ncbi:MAG TPA: tetratricopeptide repeat protein [Pyrinomonadaceae bacterium]|nr:tetratricopeptide repeat protein [Pyrinomonadaceae bacterium]
MSSPEKKIYRFADVEVDTSQNCLKRGDHEQHLRRKAFSVLVQLLEKRERLVTKEELIEIVWKDTAVTDDALVQCIKEIRRSIGDDSHHPRFIKTIPKSGYRFIGTIEEPQNGFHTETDHLKEKKETSEEPNSFFKLLAGRKVFFAILISVIAVSLLTFLGQKVKQNAPDAAEFTLPQINGKKTLAVMYFENQSGNSELEWLREGLADMLTTNLSRSPKLTILSRQQLHLLLERNNFQPGDEISFENALEIARKSRAENFITGSFSKAGEKIRVDVQLHNTQNGSFLAAESLVVESGGQILTEIDLLSLKLANHLGADETESQTPLASVMTDNLEAYRYYSLAVEKARGLHKKDALELLEKAVALDSEFAMAHARIGYLYTVTWGRAADGKPHLEKAFTLSHRLTERDRLYIAAWYAIANLDYPTAIQSFREIITKYPTETEAYLRLGYLLRGEEQFDESISVMRQGLVIDQDSPALYNALGLLYSLLGRHDEAIDMHERYVAFEPNEANAHDSLGMSYQWAGRYEEAIAEYNRALELNRNFEIAHVHLGVVYFQIGRYRAAIDWFEKYIAVAPSKLERARGYGYIAFVHRSLKNYAAAAQAANRAFKENEFNVSEQFFIASERGDKARAKKLEERLFAESGFNNRGSRNTPRYRFYHRGYIALKNGQTEEALENFREALRHSPATWDIAALEDCLAKAYLELGRLDEAASEYQRILQLNPNYPLAQFHLAQMYERKGLRAEARNAYQNFLKIWRNADADIPEVIIAKNFIKEY